MVRPLREPGRLPVHLRRRAAVAQEPARQQRRRADHRRRRRRSQPQLRRALGLRRRGIVARSGRRDLPRPERRVGARDAGDAGPDRPHQAEVPVQPALVRPVAALPAGLADRARSTPTTRSTWRLPAPTPTRPIPGFNPGQSADTLYVTNGETTDYADDQRGHGRLHARARRGRSRARASSSPTTRRWSRPSSRRRSPSTSGSPDPRRIRTIRPRRSGSTSSRSTSTRTTSTRRTGRQSLFDFKFAVSYGDPQEVRVLAKRSLGDVTLSYQINGDRCRRADERVERRRALRPRQRRPTTTSSRDGDRAPPRATGEGVVRGRRRDERLVHLRRRVRQRQAGADPRGRGLHRRLAGQAAARPRRNTSRSTPTR